MTFKDLFSIIEKEEPIQVVDFCIERPGDPYPEGELFSGYLQDLPKETYSYCKDFKVISVSAVSHYAILKKCLTIVLLNPRSY